MRNSVTEGPLAHISVRINTRKPQPTDMDEQTDRQTDRQTDMTDKQTNTCR